MTEPPHPRRGPSVSGGGFFPSASAEGLDAGKLIKLLREKYGVTVAGGQDHLKGKIFRIAHLGYSDTFDIITAIAGTEMCLKELGVNVPMGKGVAAAEEILLQK